MATIPARGKWEPFYSNRRSRELCGGFVARFIKMPSRVSSCFSRKKVGLVFLVLFSLAINFFFFLFSPRSVPHLLFIRYSNGDVVEMNKREMWNATVQSNPKLNQLIIDDWICLETGIKSNSYRQERQEMLSAHLRYELTPITVN